MSAVVVMILIISGQSIVQARGDFNTSSDSAKYSDICYTFCTAVGSCEVGFDEVIANFTAQKMDACKLYCWYHKSCHSFTFNVQSSACSLYYAHPLYDWSSQEINSASLVIGDIDCFKNVEKNPLVPCRSIENTIKTSHELGGVLIKNNLQCLGFKKSRELSWIDCTLAIPWLFEKIADKNRNKIKIFKADNLSMCLSIDVLSSRLSAYVAPCENDTQNQIFEITSGTKFKLSSMTDPEGNGNDCFFSIKNDGNSFFPNPSLDIPLSTLRVLLPLEHGALCQRKKLEDPHGQVVGKLPFHLPGSNISVRCNSGYGFKKFNFQSTLNITCRNEKTRGPKCAKHKPKEKKSPLVRILVCSNLAQAILIIFLGVLVMTSWIKIRALKANKSTE